MIGRVNCGAFAFFELLAATLLLTLVLTLLLTLVLTLLLTLVLTLLLTLVLTLLLTLVLTLVLTLLLTLVTGELDGVEGLFETVLFVVCELETGFVFVGEGVETEELEVPLADGEDVTA